ncbi:MAG TPA: DNA/RNA helicase domain-containing protein, partial [Patescibacteria group bacterium]|nr:DNA/RNA helicase domain-containing protein [Patescibacteria group bacterium]
MIVYQSTKQGFNNDVITNNIEVAILDIFQKKLGRTTTKNEISSWKNSMMYMQNILEDDEIPSDCGVMIEYQIPQTSKRIDFILTGQNDTRMDHAVIVELKQWEKAEMSELDGVVNTFVGRRIAEHPHPSYQAWSYAALLENFNEAVQKENIKLKPCAYLHNYSQDDVITNAFYKEHLEKAPAFLRNDVMKLRAFIKQFVKYGDKGKVMFQIESGKIRPSKVLADSLAGMLKGNQEFVMIDDQKIVFEKAIFLAKKSSDENKNVFIVEGGPGTGKSVVAINLLVELTKNQMVCQYVSKNAAPRAVYESKLVGTHKKTEISNLFSGSGAYVNARKNVFDALIVDEAHRLNEKSGMFKNMGENQIK